MPVQVVVQVARSDTMEPLHPTSPSTVIRVDILYMKRPTSNANALCQINGLMNDAPIFRITLVNRRAVRAQHSLTVQSTAYRVIDGVATDDIRCLPKGLHSP